MAIILPTGHPSISKLSAQSMLHTEDHTARITSIQRLRIGIFNVMPQAEIYEQSLLIPLAESPLLIKPVFIRSEKHDYRSSNSGHLQQYYQTFRQAVISEKLDGLLITGAPVEKIPFESVNYWQELKGILDYAKINILSTLGICWGGMALAYYLGIQKELYSKKVFGVFAAENKNLNHPVTGFFDDRFYTAHSRYAGLQENSVRELAAKGDVKILGSAPDAGTFLLESADRRFLMHLGHPEYTTERILYEYSRDQAAGLNNIPAGLNTDNPCNNWRENGRLFFQQWLADLCFRKYYQ